MLAACSSGSSSSGAAAAGSSAPAGGTSAAGGSGTGLTVSMAQEIAASGISPSTGFCGTKQITLGIEDGFGINAWSQESMAAVRSEAAKCPNVKTIVSVGGGSLQTAISQINSMVAQGANAIVVIPDFGQAELPAIKAATTAGVKVVPWGADPGGTPGQDYVTYVDWNSGYAGTLWANWMVKVLGGKGNVVMTGGPAGNPVTTAQLNAIVSVFAQHPGMHLLTGSTGWAVTNWDPSQAQQVAASLLGKYPVINGIISDYGTDALAETRAFGAAGRTLVPIATLEANGLGCLYQQKSGGTFQLATISSRNWLGRIAVRKAIAAAEGVTDNEPSTFSLPLIENSAGGLAPVCSSTESADYYNSNKISAADLAT
ncbi:MAG TPA: substrate-binding domain-containing protein, partial [Streptosporangiaceae bacterium]|nr:substrate-binding domain-containing protein [Streptosporangiaceae bacterium]